MVLQRDVAAAVRAQLAVPWLPPHCRLPLHSETQVQRPAVRQTLVRRQTDHFSHSFPLQGFGPLHGFQAQPLSLPYCTKGPDKRHQKGNEQLMNEGPFSPSAQLTCGVTSELQDYQRDVLPPVTAQPSHHASVAASIMEQHAAELTAAQEWDNEWKSQGLLSRLTPQASPGRVRLCAYLQFVGLSVLSASEQEYRSRKLSRLHKRIREQLRSAALPPPDSSFAGPRSGSDLGELLQAFRGSAPSDGVLAKGTHFTHTQKFTFTQVRAAPAELRPGWKQTSLYTYARVL